MKLGMGEWLFPPINHVWDVIFINALISDKLICKQLVSAQQPANQKTFRNFFAK